MKRAYSKVYHLIKIINSEQHVTVKNNFFRHMKLVKLLPVALFFLFFSCEDTLSCIIPKEPELPNKSFPIASTESYYYSDINAEINNEPRDDDYDYFFDVVGLPLGMDYYVNYRRLSIEGTPLNSGTYTT